MPLSTSDRLGPYEILAPLGAGGMGEVYRARDVRLKRQVAIKILPPLLAADPDRLARLQREAEVLASLNHPHIAALYGLEEADGVKALVMELVEGPTLAERIARGPIPLDEALPVAKQITEALEAAHEKGIIHRDLKPANIKLRADGMVKVLDFGLAKSFEQTLPDDLTRAAVVQSPAATVAGVIMGRRPICLLSRRVGRPSTNARTSGRSAACCSRCFRPYHPRRDRRRDNRERRKRHRENTVPRPNAVLGSPLRCV